MQLGLTSSSFLGCGHEQVFDWDRLSSNDRLTSNSLPIKRFHDAGTVEEWFRLTPVNSHHEGGTLHMRVVYGDGKPQQQASTPQAGMPQMPMQGGYTGGPGYPQVQMPMQGGMYPYQHATPYGQPPIQQPAYYGAPPQGYSAAPMMGQPGQAYMGYPAAPMGAYPAYPAQSGYPQGGYPMQGQPGMSPYQGAYGGMPPAAGVPPQQGVPQGGPTQPPHHQM